MSLDINSINKMVSARRPPPLRLVRSICLSAIATSICSSWLPLVVAKDAPPKSAADYFVDSLPGAPDPPLKMYAGHIDITPEHHGNLFFWFFQNRHIANKQRTLVWLNGGPGCSSMDGALMEIGPYRVNEDLTLNPNNGSWDEFSNVLFVDNPVGTGFSYVDGDSYVEELDQMADQMIQFLEKWYTIFPEYDRDDVSTSVAADGMASMLTWTTVVHRGRILRGTAHPVRCQGHPPSQFSAGS